jgi:hypothetical protein
MLFFNLKLIKLGGFYGKSSSITCINFKINVKSTRKIGKEYDEPLCFCVLSVSKIFCLDNIAQILNVRIYNLGASYMGLYKGLCDSAEEFENQAHMFMFLPKGVEMKRFIVDA